MPNKFLVETALDIGIANLEKTRNTSAKKLYDEVTSAIDKEPSDEMRALYQRYIDLYDKSVKDTGSKSGALSEEIKWKNISDLKKAVENNANGLSRADIEGLNKFALAEYNRQNSSPDSTLFSGDTKELLNKWFRIYEAYTTPAKEKEKVDDTSVETIGKDAPSMATVFTQKEELVTGASSKSIEETKTEPSLSPQPTNVIAAVESKDIFTTREKIIFKDGAYYLTGPKGNTRRVDMKELVVSLNLPKDAPENLQKSVKMIEDFSLLLDAYIAANPKETAKYESAIKQVQGLFAHEDVQMGKKILDVTSITNGMFDNFWRIFSDIDIKKVNDAFRIQDESARSLAIMNFIRENLGQSDIVLGKIMQNNPGYFAFPSDENISAENGDLSAAGLSISGRQAVENAIRKAQQEAAGNWAKNDKEYIAQFQAQNPGVQVDEDEAKKLNEKLTVLAFAKREIMYQRLYRQDLKSSPDLALAQDIMGAAPFDMSDKSWDVSKEIGGLIAMEAIAIAAGVVTAGTATVAINAAILGRNAYRGAKALEAYNALSNTKKVLTTSARILGSGVGFEAGAATTRSYIENGDFTSMHSVEGYTQSIAMMGVIGGIGKLVSTGKLGQGIQFKEGAGFAKNVLPFTGQVVIDGTAIFGTSATIGSVMFDRKDNWTLEQMAQAMLMATLFKGAGRVFAKKGKDGEPEVFPAQNKISEGMNYKEGDVVYYKASSGKTSEYEITKINPENGKVTLVNREKKGTAFTVSSKKFESGINEAKDLFTTRQIIKEDISAIETLIERGEYPRFLGSDGSVWSIRSVKVENGVKKYEIGKLGHESNSQLATEDELIMGINANINKFKKTSQNIANSSSGTSKPATPENLEVKPSIGSREVSSSQAEFAFSSKTIDKQVSKVMDSLKKEGESLSVGELSIVKEGKQYRVKTPEGEYVISGKEAQQKIISYLQANERKANEFIDKAVKEHLQTLPKGKSKTYGEHTIFMKEDGNLEVRTRDGQVLNGERLETFYKQHGEKVLNDNMKSWLSLNGNKKISETDKIFGVSTTQLLKNNGKFYNPITWGKGLVNMTWNELMQPVQTVQALKTSLTTQGSLAQMGNNMFKAVVLRDINKEWLSLSSAGTLAVRGTLLTGATAAAINVTTGPNLVSNLLMIPTTTGYSLVTGDTHHTNDEHTKMAFSTYYGGMLWGTLISQMIGGMPQN